MIEHVRAKSERGVRQDLYAAFTRGTLLRQFVNRFDSDLNSADSEDLPAKRELQERPASRRTGDRSHLPETEPDGQPVRQADHGRPVTMHTGREAGPKLQAGIKAAQVQMAPAVHRLTSVPYPKAAHLLRESAARCLAAPAGRMEDHTTR